VTARTDSSTIDKSSSRARVRRQGDCRWRCGRRRRLDRCRRKSFQNPSPGQRGRRRQHASGEALGSASYRW